MIANTADLSAGVQRILAWCIAGCVLVREGGSWRLDRPADWPAGRGPAPKPILDNTARAAIEAGATVGTMPDLFDAAETRRAA